MDGHDVEDGNVNFSNANLLSGAIGNVVGARETDCSLMTV